MTANENPGPLAGATGVNQIDQLSTLVLEVHTACAQTLTTPAVWKRTVGIPPGKEGAKDRARAEAIRRWPSKAALFARKRDDGRAEACLIAVAGMLREKRL
jgi:hypothetical protein